MRRGNGDGEGPDGGEGAFDVSGDDFGGGSGDSSTRFVQWNRDIERVLRGWADQARCYSALHAMCVASFERWNAAVITPALAVVGLTGASNLGVGGLLPMTAQTAWVIGALTTVAAAIVALARIRRWDKRAEEHRSAAVSWGKLQRRMQTELSMAPEQRSACYELTKYARAEFDSLEETQPVIPDTIIKAFNAITTDPAVLKPDVCAGIRPTQVFTPTLVQPPPFTPPPPPLNGASTAARLPTRSDGELAGLSSRGWSAERDVGGRRRSPPQARRAAGGGERGGGGGGGWSAGRAVGAAGGGGGGAVGWGGAAAPAVDFEGAGAHSAIAVEP